MCKTNSPGKTKRKQHGMCKRNSPHKNEDSMRRVRETKQNKNEASAGCVRETPLIKLKVAHDV